MKPMFKWIYIGLSALLLILVSPFAAMAADGSIDTGDTAFVLLCSALVMLMTPGLAFFYGGLVRKKNVLSILMQCLTIMGIVSVQWVLFGYSLSFGPDIGQFIGSLNWAGLNAVTTDPSDVYAATIPHLGFAGFQLMFAIITAGLIIGAFAERMRFPAFVLFILLWTTFVYDPIAHWVWGGGWLMQLGALDFAGGTVVHISSGLSGLIAALVIGRRAADKHEIMMPHNMSLVVIGGGLLWFGWFGFNAGSALGANGLAALAFVTTNTCAAAATLSWIAVEWMHHGKPTVLGAVSGALAGLVTITPAAGFVSPVSAIFMGLLVSPLCYLFVSKVKVKLGYDDSLDAFGIHGIGGTFGALATGVFASKAINPAGADGLLLGGTDLFIAQLTAVAVTYIFAGVMTFVILKLISLFVPLRVSDTEEKAGLDMAIHGEDAYGYYGYKEIKSIKV